MKGTPTVFAFAVPTAPPESSEVLRDYRQRKAMFVTIVPIVAALLGMTAYNHTVSPSDRILMKIFVCYVVVWWWWFSWGAASRAYRKSVRAGYVVEIRHLGLLSLIAIHQQRVERMPDELRTAEETRFRLFLARIAPLAADKRKSGALRMHIAAERYRWRKATPH